MVVAEEAATATVVVVRVRMEDVTTTTSTKAPALETGGMMMSCGDGWNLCSVKKKKKGKQVWFVFCWNKIYFYEMKCEAAMYVTIARLCRYVMEIGSSTPPPIVKN